MQISRVQRNLLNGYILIQLYPSVLIFYFSVVSFFLLFSNAILLYFSLHYRSVFMAFQLSDTYIHLNIHSKVKPYTVVWLIIDFALALLSKIARMEQEQWSATIWRCFHKLMPLYQCKTSLQ